MKFSVPIFAFIEADSQADADLAAARVGKLLSNATLKMLLQTSGVRLAGPPTVGKPVKQ